MFRSVRTAGLQGAVPSGLSELGRCGPAVASAPRPSGGSRLPGTGGTLAHRLMRPASRPGASRRFTVAAWGTSAGVQFRFRSCFSGDESEESSNISSPLTGSACGLGENGRSPDGDAARELAGLDLPSELPSRWESRSAVSSAAAYTTRRGW